MTKSSNHMGCQRELTTGASQRKAYDEWASEFQGRTGSRPWRLSTL